MLKRSWRVGVVNKPLTETFATRSRRDVHEPSCQQQHRRRSYAGRWPTMIALPVVSRAVRSMNCSQYCKRGLMCKNAANSIRAQEDGRRLSTSARARERPPWLH